MTRAAAWFLEQPKNADGKVDGKLLVAEGRRRGYCVCPKPMRQMIDFTMEGNPGLSEPFTCAWCEQPETRQSREFWYLEEDGGSSA